MTTILIADDHQLLRDTWAFFLGQDNRFKILGTCADTEEAVLKSAAHRPDIMFMDINMKPFNGIEATRKIVNVSPETRVIAVTMHSHTDFVHKMLKAGARGYLTKNASIGEMAAAIQDVLAGNIFICAEMKKMLDNGPGASDRFAAIELLTEREKEIIHLIKLGRSSRQISKELFLSTHTVDAHRHNLMKKLKVKNAAELVNLMNASEIYL